MKMTLSRWVGLVLLAALLAYAFVLPLIQHGDPLQQDLLQMLQTPNRSHLLGFDHLGRDMLTRLSAALRLSLGLAALCVGVGQGEAALVEWLD